MLIRGGKTGTGGADGVTEASNINRTTATHSHTGTSAGNITTTSFKTIREEIVYNGKYRKILQRDVVFPDNKTVTFDVLTQGCGSVVVFAWDSKTRTTTLIREYHPGIQRLMYGCPAGMFEQKKHQSALQCAQFEFEEETQLRSSKWIPLLADEYVAMPFDKYSDNRFHPFLALDPEQVENPRALDDEEFIIVENNVPYERVRKLMESGQMNVVSTYATLLATRKLQEMGFPLSSDDNGEAFN